MASVAIAGVFDAAQRATHSAYEYGRYFFPAVHAYAVSRRTDTTATEYSRQHRRNGRDA